MSELSSEFRYYRTTDADAVAADLAEGKIAVNNDGEIIGTHEEPHRDYDDGVILDISFPTGQAGAYTPVVEDCLQLIPNAGFAATSGVLTADGYIQAQNGIAYQNIISLTPPAQTRAGRVYEIHGRTKNALPTSDRGFRIDINRLDGSNVWPAYVIWSGAYWRTHIAEIVAGAWAIKAPIVDMNSDVDYPIAMVWKVIDYGDTIMTILSAFETDDLNAAYCTTSRYYAASRPNKDRVHCALGFNNVSNDEAEICRMRVYDI